jgi:SSS family solute:Na+ symporter
MHFIDMSILALYFLGVGLIGYYSSKKNTLNAKSYFLGGSNIGWVAIAASLFASNISAEHFIGLAGSGAAGGLAVGQFEWLACFILIILGWVFVPFYLKTGVFTMPEFLEKRYNRGCRNYLAIVSIIAYVFTKVSVSVYAGAIVLNTILGWNIWFGAIVLVIATGLYTAFGGLRAVIFTDYFQAIVLIGGAILLTVISITQVGGLSILTSKVSPSFFSVWKSFDHPDFPWTGILFGAPILGIWYWCTDQMIVQRVLASKNIEVARKSTILAGFLKILPVFILVMPGIAGAVLYPNVAPNEMYATMVNTLLPVGVKGLVVAALLAALMSSLSSVFNSSSTLIVMDFYKEFRPNAKEKELVSIGKIATFLLVVIALVWIPFIGIMSDQLFVYLQSVQAYISPPIAAVFLLGILSKKVNGTGALTALISGFVFGAVRFISEIGIKAGWINSDFLNYYVGINFLHFALFLFIVSSIIMIVVSYLKPDMKDINMFMLVKEYEKTACPITKRASFYWSAVLSLIILVLWVYFSPLFW